MCKRCFSVIYLTLIWKVTNWIGRKIPFTNSDFQYIRLTIKIFASYLQVSYCWIFFFVLELSNLCVGLIDESKSTCEKEQPVLVPKLYDFFSRNGSSSQIEGWQTKWGRPSRYQRRHSNGVKNYASSLPTGLSRRHPRGHK